MTPTMITTAILMVGMGAAILLWFRGDLSAGSARRMTGMMRRIDLDPTALGDPRAMAMLKVAQRRCRKCPGEDLCDRWLAGEVRGGNAFCSNAQTFRHFRAPDAATA